MTIARCDWKEKHLCSAAKTWITMGSLSILEFSMMLNPDPVSSSV
jgi:hypothetical protein